jgi:hypothetical protein
MIVDGIYSVVFRGVQDWGLGMLLFSNGQIVGADSGGALYDGTFKVAGDNILASVTMTVPPGVVLVQGTAAQPTEYVVPMDVNVPAKSFLAGHPVLIQMPPGPVNAIFKRLRGLEASGRF